MTRLPDDRKPRILIAGEFSAGKTQLINGLLDQPALPSNVTSTSLPPVWISADHSALSRVPVSGPVEAIDHVEGVPVEGTAYCTMPLKAEILTHVDLIDTPGNSDPNIPAESWQRMLDYADAVIWCTNAVQAWRQSEKAVWQSMPAALRKNTTLLITHADRLIEERSRGRLLRRVGRDASAFFDEIMLVSLIAADDIDQIAQRIVAIAQDIDLIGRAQDPSDEAHSIMPRRPRAMKRSADASDRVHHEAEPATPEEAAEAIADSLLQQDDAPGAPPRAEEAAAAAAQPPVDQDSAEPDQDSPTPDQGDDMAALISEAIAEPDTAPARVVNVVPLFDTGIDIPAETPETGPSPARKIWDSVKGGHDLKTVDDWADCVKKYIDAVDAAFEGDPTPGRITCNKGKV